MIRRAVFIVLFLSFSIAAFAVPSITSLTPSTGAVGASITIAGSGFGTTQGTSTVKFNGTAATATSWSASSITATVPAGATTGNVVVTVSGVASNGKSFTVVAAPSITTLSPTSGPAGTSVTITGANFGTTQGSSTVKFNGTTATPTSWSATSIKVPVPAGATTGNVVVHASGVDSNGSSFTVIPTPSITSLSPTSGAVGASVTITGTNFGATQGTSTVKFNGTTATATSWSATSIVATVPAGATTGNVVVTVSGVASNGSSFTVVAAPNITSLSPTSGTVGTSITITGTNFGSTQGSNTVKFNGTAATPTSWSATSIKAPVPAGATTGNVVVHASGVDSNGSNFTVLPTPSITSLSPASGAVGASVTITGTNFGATQGSSTIKFNGTTASATSWSATSVVATVPTGATTGNVVVTVSGVVSNGSSFTVVAAPSITSISPASGSVGTSVTITGANFGASQGSSTVKFNGMAATPTSWSAASIKVPVPSGATTGNVVVHASGVDSNGKPFTVTAGSFTSAGSMNVFKDSFTATLLSSGKVLVAGGQGSDGNAVNDAELYDPSAGTFSTTGGLNTPRFSHSATLLPSGTTLIAGGAIRDSHGNVVPQASAEIYNAGTGAFTAGGTLNVARYTHTATLLNNGLVLIAGGSALNGASVISSAELYNPATGTFTPTGSLNTGRYNHTAALLNNGLVLIVGGTGNGGSLASAEIYNPATGTFSTTGNLNIARSQQTATLLNSGLVLVAGGSDTSGASLGSAELYNPATGVFTTTGSLAATRDLHSATLLTNGTVLIAGGFSSSTSADLASAEIYDPATATFSATASLNDGRCCHTATLLTNGTVLVAGGADNTGLTNTAELYQPNALTPPTLSSITVSPVNPTITSGGAQAFTATGTFTDNSTQTLASAVWSSSNPAVATATNDATNHGQAIGIAGGSATVSACAGSICGSTTLTVKLPPPSLASLSQSSGTPGTSITINGANFGNTQGSSTITFNGTSATPTNWGPGSIVVPVPSGATTGPVVVTVGGLASNGLNFIVGTLSSLAITPPAPVAGVNSTLQLSTTGTYSEGSTLDLTTSATWSSSNTAIATVSTAGVVSGVAVGQTSIQAAVGSVNTSVTLVVTTNPRLTGNLNTARASHTATLLSNGTVLIAGGTGFPFPLNAELYNPATASFSTAAPLNNPRYFHTATLLNSGMVLIAGGANQNRAALASAELYDSTSGNFIVTGNLSTPRYNHTATLLSNGKVLLVGGHDQAGNIFATSELFDPSTGTFTASGSLANARYSQTATLLNNGKVLIAGGWGPNNSAPASAELYDPVSGTFSAAGNVSISGGPFAPVLLNSGKVLVAAGPAAELYDPVAGSFTLIRCCTALSGLTATLLNNGTVFTAGGFNSGSANVSEIYDPVAGTLTSLGNLNTPRWVHTATLLKDGTALIVGGQDSGNNVLASAEIYAPNGQTPASLVSIAISPVNPTFPAETAQRLTATGAFSDNSSQTLASVTWNSSNSSVLTVSNDATDAGQAFGLKAGSAIVTACAGSKCGSTMVTVGVPAPAIAALSPASGTVGTVVAIRGSGFGPTQGSSTVTFNGAPASVTSWYSGSIVAVIPANASTGNVVVTVSGAASNGVAFTMPRVITGLSANTGLPGASVTITGSNFGTSTGIVTFNGQSAAISNWSNTSIVAVVPSGATSGNVVVSNSGVQSNGVPFTVGPIVYGFERSITLDHTKVPNTDQVNFPVLISGTFNYLATTANGGQVQNANGYDIVFTTDIAGTNKLDHEIESYDPVTGTINFWVRIPLLSHSTDTVIFVQYGSNVVITSQENRARVWDGNYQMVLHLGEAAAPYRDSTSNAYASTGGGASYPAQGQGKIGKGQSYNGGVGQYIAYAQSQSPNPNGAITMEAWVKTGSSQVGIFQKGQATSSYGMWVSNTAQGTLGATNGGSVGITGTSVINDNVWHHVVVAAPPTGNIVLYTDGVQNTVVNNSSPLLATVADPLLVGISCANCTALTGTLDEVRISNSVRSADWVAAEYNNQSSPAAFAAMGQQNAPVITVVSPSSGEAGSSFTITGNGFTSTQGTVTLNGHAATVSSWSSTSIVAVVPFGTTSGPVVVTAGGVPTNGFGFTVLQPTIANLGPNTGNPGTSVTITGANFDATQGAGGVTFGGVPASIASWSATSITAYVPASATSGNVVVTAPNGVASNGVSFSVTDNFAVTLLSPATGPAGTTVNIIGGGFGASQGSSIVELNGVSTTVSNWSENQITALVPVGASTGTVNVTIGSSTAVSPSPFVISTSVQIADSFERLSSYTSSILGGTWLGSAATGSGCSSCTVRGNVQSAFDASGNLLTFIDELGHVTNYTYDASGNVASQSAQLNTNTAVTTSYTYNSFGEPLTVTDPLGNTTTNTYDANGNLLTVTSPAPNSSTAASVTQFAYDSKGELTQVTDPLNHITTFTYTPAGMIATITDAQQNVTTYQYDAHGNRTAVIDALQHQTSFAYDAMDRLTTITYPDQTTASFGYDSRGRRTSVTDQNGKVTNYTYDDADRVTQVKDAANNVTQYAYDTENNPLSITDANGHATSFAYDAFGRAVQTTFPSTLTETFLYDAAGNLVSKTDRNGHSILYVYDALNRLTHKGYPDATGVDYIYDLAGKIKQVSAPAGVYGMANDNMGRLIGTTTQYSFLPGSPAPTFSNSYSYDAASNRTQFTAPDGSTNTYQYDTLNRQTTLTNSLTGQFTFSYDVLNRRTGLNRPNMINTTYGYDSLSRLLSVLHQSGTATADGASYTYDNAGNRTTKTNKLNNVAEQYTYDALYQLQQVTHGTTTTESYTYDAVGNRLSSSSVPSYSYNSSNELTSATGLSYTYDSNGNTLSKTNSGAVTQYTWDFENRLSSVILPGSGGTMTFKYDPFGRRIQKAFTQGSTTTTTNYIYDGSNSVEEIDQNGNVLARYTQADGIDEPLSEVRSGTTSYYQQDGLGSATSLSNSTGSLANTYVYDSFGNLTTSSGTATNPFQYTGRDYDPETGLRYYRARYYSPEIGRFISEDPIRFSAGVNFFNYVSGNPTNFIDPSGLATLNYWGAQFKGPYLQRWGHISLTLDDGTYISFYPSDFSIVHPNSPAVLSGALGDDNLNENGKPDIQLHLDNLDETAIKAWWDNYKKTKPMFRGYSNNCSTVVSKAFDVGGGRKHVPEFGQGFLYWTPGAVLEYGRELQKAGQGIYVEPLPKWLPYIK